MIRSIIIHGAGWTVVWANGSSMRFTARDAAQARRFAAKFAAEAL